MCLAAEAGLVGGLIEDASGDMNAPICDFSHAVERIAAAVEAACALPFPFTLVARAESFLHGRADLDDIIRRLQAFERAGADARRCARGVRRGAGQRGMLRHKIAVNWPQP